MRELRWLQEENRRMKKIVADQAQDIDGVKLINRGNFHALRSVPGRWRSWFAPAGILAAKGLCPEISNWLVTALKQSANDHREFTETQVDSLVGRMKDFRRRLDLIQMDRIDGRITEKRYENRKQGLEKDETEVAAKIERLDHAGFQF
jgi:hypothetical protein